MDLARSTSILGRWVRLFYFILFYFIFFLFIFYFGIWKMHAWPLLRSSPPLPNILLIIPISRYPTGFVFIEANVKKWGLAPMQGTLAPPPAYGSDAGTTLLETGNSRPPQDHLHSERRA